jgi:hypothetical protein
VVVDAPRTIVPGICYVLFIDPHLHRCVFLVQQRMEHFVEIRIIKNA